jgi:hypothetical protein
LLLVLAAPSALADWPNTNATKWVQFPDATARGYDVLAAQGAAGTQPIILADDFACTTTGPVTDIHIWASWLVDTINPQLPITLGIWSDVPAVTNATGVTPSHPGSMLWSESFGAGGYAIKAWRTANEQFWNPDPAPNGTILGLDKMIWQYNFYPTKPFFQQGSPTAPIVHWLSMTAGANVQTFGWKTATNHWGDDAVFGHLDPASGQAMGDWKELRDPLNTTGGRSLDLAFALTTPGEAPTPPPSTNKWVQYPDQSNGIDVKDTLPNILADDFRCTASGSITNIQLWGSWQDDATPDPKTTFVLGIWSDVPPTFSTASAGAFSRPGQLLWTETFVPGGYDATFYTNGTEQFYDPATGQLSRETKIWGYSFNPKAPFCQQGSTNNPVTYWLSAYAQTAPPLFFGWKSSTNHWRDDAVYGHLNAAGTAVGDWQALHDPTIPTALISLDLAFLINNGPPCDPNQRPKFIQWPDPSANGLDVRATAPKVLGDDFWCRIPGPINGVTLWGSWLNDQVDTNASFQLSLYTDVPAITGTPSFSQPGQLICSTTFSPPQTVGTSVPRYKYQPYLTNVQEQFYDPDLPGASGFLGKDSQIWRYDFYPRQTCWKQSGRPGAQRTYWLAVSAVTDTNKFLFGWKTSTNHWSDDGVYGHLNSDYLPLGDWKALYDPRSGQSLDLSFALRSFPIVGINKDLKNLTDRPADGVQIVVAGEHEITFHYDDSPAWPVFAASSAGGNTVVQWTGKTVPAGGITHVGFEMGGASLTIVSMSWLSSGTVIGTPIQVNHHTWGNGSVLTLNNNLVAGPVTPTGGMVEFYADPVPLDEMNPGFQRTPLASMTLPIQPEPIMPGGVMRVPLPQAPPGAQYAMFLLNLADAQGNAATMDFLQLPLDAALQPVINNPPGVMANGFGLRWPSIVGRRYRVQAATDLRSSFFDVFFDLAGTGDEMNVLIPITGSQGFYRVVLDPE